MESLLKFRKEIQTYSRSHPNPPGTPTSQVCWGGPKRGVGAPGEQVLLAQLSLLPTVLTLILAAGPFTRLQGTRPLSIVNSITLARGERDKGGD